MSVQIAQRVQYAYNAGFRNTNAVEGLSIIVAISLAECGIGSSSGCETGCDAGGDAANSTCGVWQIYQPAHPGTRSCAIDPACCATIAWSLSHNTGFTAWSTYNSGAFRSHLDAVRATIASMPAPIGAARAPIPNPPPTPQPPPPPVTQPPASQSSAVLAALLLAGAVGAAWYGARGHKITVTGSQGFGEGHIAVSPRTVAGRRAPAGADDAFGNR